MEKSTRTPDLAWRAGLASVARCRGGLRETARQLGADYSNVRRWFAGEPTLREEFVERLPLLLGFVAGRLAPGLHQWEDDAPRRFFRSALSFVFPTGARAVARASSRLVSLPRTMKFLTMDLSPEPYVIGAENTYVFIRRPAGLSLTANDLGPAIELTYVPDALFARPPWTSGSPTLTDVTDVMGATVPSATSGDLLSFLSKEGISPAEALVVLSSYAESRGKADSEPSEEHGAK